MSCVHVSKVEWFHALSELYSSLRMSLGLLSFFLPWLMDLLLHHLAQCPGLFRSDSSAATAALGGANGGASRGACERETVPQN